MTTYVCDDAGCGNDILIEAASPYKAAREYVEGADWGQDEGTTWVDVVVTPLDDDGERLDDETVTITVAVDPPVPPCSGDEHDFQSVYELVGGLQDNPGVYGHGGGVTIHTVCVHCGVHHHVDTWAQNPENGEQGLTREWYEPADDETLAWIEDNS